MVRLARENDWGFERIEGELLKLGYTISHETVGNILRRRGIPPAPERETSPSWRHLMTHYKDQLIACDFFAVEALFLQTLYVLVFIEIGSRRTHFAGCAAHPNSAWVTQQARQLMWNLEDREPGIRFLIRDNDKKFTESFDTVFRSEGDLDKLIIVNQTHLRRVMREYILFFNTARPHQGIDQQPPIPSADRRADPFVIAMCLVGSSVITTATLRRRKSKLYEVF